MQKKAPVWGKAIGIIMISLGGLGVFYQMYKLIVPAFFSAIPRQFENISHNAPGFSDIFGIENSATILLIFGLLGMALIVFYIIGGVRLLTAKPQNYNFAKYALIAFITFNIIQGIVIFGLNTGFVAKILLIYSIIGLVFDIVLVIILQSSNKADYGIGNTPEPEHYTLDQKVEEDF